jgi:hypothetical protein
MERTAMDTASPNKPKRAPPSEAEEVEEVDVWWGGYAGRTMVPELVLAGLLTVSIVGLAWYSGAWQNSNLLRSTTLILLGGFWLSQTARWLYRVLSTNYRLEYRLLERLAGVGRIRIMVQDPAAPPLVLEGIRDPEHIVMLIRTQVQHVREQE